MPNEPRPGLVSLRRIEVWNRGVELVVDLYELTRQFPREEIFGLTRQLRRAAVAIPSDIAEGNQRHSLPDRRRFLTDAQGSLAEIDTQLEISSRLGYVDDGQFVSIIERTDHIARMLTNMYRNMRSHP